HEVAGFRLDGDPVGEGPHDEAYGHRLTRDRRHYGAEPRRVTPQARAVTCRSNVHAEIPLLLFQPDPPIPAWHPGHYELRQAGVGSSREEVDRDPHRVPRWEIEPFAQGDRRPVNLQRTQGAREGYVALSASFGPAKRPGQRSEERRVGKECRSRWSP